MNKKKEKVDTPLNEETDYLAKGKAIKEFIAVIGFCQKWIDTYLELGQYQYEENVSDYLDDRLESYLEEYYTKNRTVFYKQTDTLFNDSIQIDLDAFYKGINSGNETETAWHESIEGNDNQSEAHLYANKVEEIKYFTATGKLSISQLFKDETFLKELYDIAEDNVQSVEQESKDLYAADLRLVIANLKSIDDKVNDSSKKVETEIRFWHKRMLEKTETLLEIIMEKGDKTIFALDKVLILDTLFTAIDIIPNSIGKKCEFFAAIIGTTKGGIKDALSTLNTEPKDSSEKRKTKAKEMFGSLKGKVNATTKIEPKGNEIIKKIEMLLSEKSIK